LKSSTWKTEGGHALHLLKTSSSGGEATGKVQVWQDPSQGMNVHHHRTQRMEASSFPAPQIRQLKKFNRIIEFSHLQRLVARPQYLLGIWAWNGCKQAFKFTETQFAL